MPRYLYKFNGRSRVITAGNLKHAEDQAVAQFQEFTGHLPDEELGDRIQIFRISARDSHDIARRRREHT